MKVLVTGATGFIGSRLTKRLLSDGNDVHVILRRGSDLDLIGVDGGAVTVHRLREDGRGVRDCIAAARPEVTFHLASLFLAQHAHSDVRELVTSNVLFGAELVDALVSQGSSRLVVAGTSWQHFNGATYDPVCLYAATKQAFEDLLVFWQRTTPIRSIVMKLFDTYGVGDRRAKLVPLLLRIAKDDVEMDFSPGNQLLDLVHVNDVVEAFAVAGNRTADMSSGDLENYGVTSGEPISVRSVVELFESVLGRRLPIKWGRRPYRPREVMCPWSSSPLLPGWRPNISLRDGFRQVIHGHV